MGKLTNIFGIIALILAIGAAVLSFLVGERRVEFRQRADRLATTIDKMVKEIDSESGSAVSSEVNFIAGNKEAGTLESGSLGWKAFSDAKDEGKTYSAFDAPLNKAIGHAKAINTQRNSLAETIKKMSEGLALPEGELDIANLRNLGDNDAFTNAAAKAEAHVTAVAARDKAMLTSLAQAGGDIEHPIEENLLSVRESTTNEDGDSVLGDYPCQETLATFNQNVKNLKLRAESYADTVVEGIGRVSKHDGIFDWTTDPDLLKSDSDYEGALTSLLNDFDNIEKQFKGYKVAKGRIIKQKDRIDELEVENDSIRGELEATQDKLAQANAKMKEYEKRVVISGPGGNEGGALVNDLEGEVIDFNDEFDYVILNLGSHQVSENTELLIARGDKMVAKIVVAKVLSKISVADIVPLGYQHKPKAGDRVILSLVQE